MRFSERQGFYPVKRVLQFDSMDDGLRNRLWNGLASLLWQEPRQFDSFESPSNYSIAALMRRLWHEHFKKPIDTIPRSCTKAIDVVRRFYFSCQWYEVYDLLEFIGIGIRIQVYKAACSLIATAS